jgi:hypothetical protein
MSLDDRIRQLSETIIEEVRSPIETALHGLLEDAMRIAADDRDRAVQSAAATAAAEHDAALAALTSEHETAATALRENLEREHEEKLAALRAGLTSDHEAATAALRETLESEHGEKLGALRAGLTSQHETATAALREGLEREHDEKLATLRTGLISEHETAAAALRAGLTAEHETGTATLRQQLADERDAAVASALATARAQFDEERDQALVTLRAALDRERDSALTELRDDLARDSAAALQAAREEAAHESERAVQAVRDELARAHQSSLDTVRTAAEVAAGATLTAALARAEHGKHEAEARAAALDQEIAQVRATAIRAQEESSKAEQTRLAAEQDLGAAVAVEREQELACSERTLAAFRQLDDAPSLTGVLRILADEAATEIGRVAVLLVVDSRLRGWEVRGLPSADAAAIDAPVVAGTVFGRAIATGLPASTSDAPLGSEDDPLAALLSAPPGRAGLAVPVTVGGRVVAILYGDDAGDRSPVVPSNWPEVAEILARHAGHCLELLTISHASVLAGRVQQEATAPAFRPSDESPFADHRREEDSAGRYARLLISEIKLYNEAAVDQGRSEGNLLERLGPDIDRARRLYEDKIPAAVRQRVDCFDQELVRTLAGGDPNLLGHT